MVQFSTVTYGTAIFLAVASGASVIGIAYKDTIKSLVKNDRRYVKALLDEVNTNPGLDNSSILSADSKEGLARLADSPTIHTGLRNSYDTLVVTRVDELLVRYIAEDYARK